MRYVIVGGGVASLSAIEGIRSVDRVGEILLFSEEPELPYFRPLISYVIAGKLNRSRLPCRGEDYYKEMGVKLHLGERVVEVDGGRIKVSSGKWYGWDALLISTGSKPKVPEVGGIKKEGVFTVRNVSDMDGMVSYLTRVREAVVLGGGMIGMKITDALVHAGKKVHLIISSSRVMSQVMDDEGSSMILERLEGSGVDVRFGEDIQEVYGKDGVEGVLLKNGDELKVQMVVVAKGVSPCVEPFHEMKGIRVGVGIDTDRYMRTGAERIFSAGDVAETFDPAHGKNRLNALWLNAREEGYVAGINMAGGELEYRGGIASNSIQVSGLSVVTMGISNPGNGTPVNSLKVRDEFGYRRINFREGRVVGAIFVGSIDGAGIIRSLILGRVDVRGLEEDLLSFGEGLVKLLRELYPKAFGMDRSWEWRTAKLPERVMKPGYYTPWDYGRL